MDTNQVIKLGNRIQAPADILPIINVVVNFVLIIFLFSGARKDSPLIFLAFGIAICLLLLFGGFVFETLQKRKYKKEVERWKYEIVIPYIESLQKEKKEIIFIKIEWGLSTDTNNNCWYTYPSESDRTPLTVYFKEKGMTTALSKWFDTSIELPDEQKAYVEYQKVPVNLGHGMDAGIYNATIHLPKSYTYSEIK
ncbi:hypothetical protein SMD22_00735 (plasmid) [Brevibacillus halotolerans]|nr:hypothetical protein SMD22_00735 [Brevibacillus halotolerans]